MEIVGLYQKKCIVSLDDKAKQAWTEQHYQKLTKNHPGLIGCVINRAEAQVLRLAMIYCLLNGKSLITIEHLESALAFWNFCQQSAEYIFHGRQSDNIAQKIMDSLQEGPKTATDIHRLFSSHTSKNRLETAISELLASDSIVTETKPTNGRPVTLYKMTQTVCVKSMKSGKSHPEERKNELHTLHTLHTQQDNEWEDI